jgi:DNA primase
LTLSESQRTSLLGKAKRYRSQLSESDEGSAYLKERGFTDATITAFGLGYVAQPDPEDVRFQGRIAIPYMTKCPVRGVSVVDFKYRAINDTESPKYDKAAGSEQRLFNVQALLLDTEDIYICEGEFDCIAATQAGLPTVGVPGTQAWKPFWSLNFLGYRQVTILADNDEPGLKFAAELAKKLPSPVRILPMPDGDVNSTLLAKGEDYIKELVR